MTRHRHRAAAVSSLGLAASLPLLALTISDCSAGPANATPPAAAPPAGVSVPAARFASSASIWFEPQAPGMNGPFGEVGSADYAVTALDAWHDTYKSVTGAPFPFFFADVDYDDPGWPALVKELEAGTAQLGIRFGIIYTGDMQDNSDTQWTSQVQDRFEQYQRQAGGRPDYVLFQSWQPRPTWCLPETDPTTFTGVINTYITATQRRGPPADS